MECDSLFMLPMRTSQSHHRFQNLFSAIDSNPVSSLNLLNIPKTSSSKSLLSSFRSKYLSHAALTIDETTTPTSSFNHTDTEKPQSNNLCEEFPENPNGVGLLASRGGIRSVGRDWKQKEWLRRHSSLLRGCASKGYLNKAKEIHGVVVKSNYEPDSHLSISLINVYSKCGSVGDARRVFDEMPERDVVSWTTLISGFVAKGYGGDGVSLYCEMRKEDVLPNEFTFATCLKACSLCGDLEFAKQVHAETIKVGHFSDLFVGSALVDLYAKCGEIELADRVFFWMPEQNAVSWNALLNGYAQMGDGQKVLKLFFRTTEPEMKFSSFTLSTVLKGCANSGFLREGQTIHSLTIKIGCVVDEFLSCSLADVYSKCGLLDDALKVFSRIKDPDVVAYSAMITSLEQQGRIHEAVRLFQIMRHAGVSPNQFSIGSLLSAASDHGNLLFGKSVHSFICKYGFESDSSVSNALITMYIKNGRAHDGTRVFEAMADRDIVSWNTLLSGNCDQGPVNFHRMLMDGFWPNMYTFITVLRSCGSLFNVSFGRQAHAHIVKNDLSDNDFVGTALVDMYAKNSCLEDAAIAFNKVRNRDLFCWTVIITGCAQNDQGEKAFKYFNQMQREGVKPNEFTLAGCLSGCSRLATLESGQQLHSLAIKAGHLNDTFVATALVDLYGKCGCLEDADSIFKNLVSRDTISWNAMIYGFSQHGKGEKVLEAFNQLLDEGNAPDEITFLGVLSACSHMGLIEEGKMYFNSMSKVYKITPLIEHYTCMVDILGRAGKFDEVESFIEEMNLSQNSSIWESVLGACSLHGNVELGERAAQRLISVEPNLDSNYVLLSNIFAAKGQWDDVRKIRTLMTRQGVKKEPGCSWVEADGQVHVFTSGDHSHRNIKEIKLKLKELAQDLTSSGYKPKTEQVLHNVGETEKIEHLNHHSERLALAFALISTSPLKTIRIFKNLRICVDCHDVMKFISNIADREIVVRDINRFHHFKSGTCSCQDYW